MKRMLLVAVALLFHAGFALSMRAEVPPAVVESEAHLFSEGDLDLLLGPIALYPDPLIAVLLPASTQPTEIVLAARFLTWGGNASEIDAQPWTDSVKALAHYPEVLHWMDENLAWTTQVGEAFLNQPDDVMTAIQRLRAIAQSLGNLQTTSEQIVESDDGEIDILPVNPDFIYVPVYQPWIVFTRPASNPWPAVSFANAAPTGIWLKHDWDWNSKRVVVWNKENPRPRGWWTQSRADRWKTANDNYEWAPRFRPGQAPSKWWAARQKQIEARAGKSNPTQHGNLGSQPATGGSHPTVKIHLTTTPNAAKPKSGGH